MLDEALFEAALPVSIIQVKISDRSLKKLVPKAKCSSGPRCGSHCSNFTFFFFFFLLLGRNFFSLIISHKYMFQ